MEKTSYKKLSSILAQIDGAAFIADRYARLDSRSLDLPVFSFTEEKGSFRFNRSILSIRGIKNCTYYRNYYCEGRMVLTGSVLDSGIQLIFRWKNLLSRWNGSIRLEAKTIELYPFYSIPADQVPLVPSNILPPERPKQNKAPRPVIHAHLYDPYTLCGQGILEKHALRNFERIYAMKQAAPYQFAKKAGGYAFQIEIVFATLVLCSLLERIPQSVPYGIGGEYTFYAYSLKEGVDLDLLSPPERKAAVFFSEARTFEAYREWMLDHEIETGDSGLPPEEDGVCRIEASSAEVNTIQSVLEQALSIKTEGGCQ